MPQACLSIKLGDGSSLKTVALSSSPPVRMLAMKTSPTPIVIAVFAVGLGAAGPIDPQAGMMLKFTSNSQANICSDNAIAAAEGRMAPAHAVRSCTQAIEYEALSPYERAATLNNRGVVRMGMIDEAPLAIGDFEAAARIEPDLGESYVNRGSALMRESRFAEAVAEFERGLTLKLKEPWRAYYNRGIAREALGDIPGAYADHRKALELRPGWSLATRELTRFAVRRRPAAR